MAKKQDQGNRQDLNAEEDKLRRREADSGDVSGQGRERRDDEVYPAHRNAGQFGTHGGPNKGGARNAEDLGPEGQNV